VINIIK